MSSDILSTEWPSAFDADCVCAVGHFFSLSVFVIHVSTSKSGAGTVLERGDKHLIIMTFRGTHWKCCHCSVRNLKSFAGLL